MCLGLQLGNTHSLYKTRKQIVSVSMFSLLLVFWKQKKYNTIHKKLNPNTWVEQFTETFVLVLLCISQGISTVTSSGAVEQLFRFLKMVLSRGKAALCCIRLSRFLQHPKSMISSTFDHSNVSEANLKCATCIRKSVKVHFTVQLSVHLSLVIILPVNTLERNTTKNI